MDLIDRNALKQCAYTVTTPAGNLDIVELADINDAPTVEPQGKRGEWQRGVMARDRVVMCSACKELHWTESRYCPNCGAYMRKAGENATID